MMHRIFYRCFTGHAFSGSIMKIVAGIMIGFSIGTAVFCAMPRQGLSHMVSGLVAADAGLSTGLVCAILPLVLAAALLFLRLKRIALVLSPLFSGSLLTFSAFAFGLGAPGILAWLMLLGRCVSLVYLFWFLLQPDHREPRILLTDFFSAAALTVVTILLFNWLTAPGIDVIASYI